MSDPSTPYYPPLDSPPAAPPTQKRTRRALPWIVGGVVLIIAGAAFGIGLGAGRSQNSTAAGAVPAPSTRTVTVSVTQKATVTVERTIPAVAPPPATSTAPPTAGSAAATPGASLGFTSSGAAGSGAGTATMYSAEWKADSGGDYPSDPSNGAYLVMDIGVEMTSGSGYVSDFDWEAKDADGRVWNCTSGGIYFNPGLPSGEVHAPDKVRGFVGCDLPRSDVTVIWDDELKWAVPGA